MPDAERVVSVVARHRGDLLALPGVVGVGVGRGEGGGACIVVFVRRATAETLEAIPDRLEGVPVVHRRSGELRAVR